MHYDQKNCGKVTNGLGDEATFNYMGLQSSVQNCNWHNTPFNLVIGLDAILPIEFLIPTLRVARELEWTGHEFSERLDELEKLDEF